MFATLRRAADAMARPDLPRFDDSHAILWEPCSRSHGEIVPGYARLLLDLGYRVTVFMSPARLDEGLFSRFGHPDLTLPRLGQRRISRLMRTRAIRRAGVVLVSTIGKLPHTPDHRPDLDRVFGGDRPKHLLAVEHDAKPKIDAGVWDRRTLTLRALRYKGAGSFVVNPHYFGPVRDTAPKEGKTIFLVIGAARSKRRDQGLVERAARTLLDQGIENFEIRQIGKRGGDPVDPRLARHITELGRLDFKAMYSEVDKGHFILTALSADNSDHDAYRTTKTTGSFQLCYGFHKPCIVDRAFADGTALTPQNSLLLDGPEALAETMARAIAMTGAEYTAMRAAMGRDAKALHDTSLANLRAALND